jgi:hypothetical protein
MSALVPEVGNIPQGSPQDSTSSSLVKYTVVLKNRRNVAPALFLDCMDIWPLWQSEGHSTVCALVWFTAAQLPETKRIAP